jgi:hypothetical protein
LQCDDHPCSAHAPVCVEHKSKAPALHRLVMQERRGCRQLVSLLLLIGQYLSFGVTGRAKREIFFIQLRRIQPALSSGDCRVATRIAMTGYHSLGVTERAKRELCFYVRRRLEPAPSGGGVLKWRLPRRCALRNDGRGAGGVSKWRRLLFCLCMSQAWRSIWPASLLLPSLRGAQRHGNL